MHVKAASRLKRGLGDSVRVQALEGDEEKGEVRSNGSVALTSLRWREVPPLRVRVRGQQSTLRQPELRTAPDRR